ncbi:MAG: nitrate/nitrite transporter NrtS [Alphaproteobacteria bacterium]
MKQFLALARQPAVVRRALMVALVVGTALTLINQGDRLIAGLAPGWIKMALTYLVPYCVSTHGAVTAMRDEIRRTQKK